MKIETHQINDQQVAEVVSDTSVIATTEDGLDLLGNLYFLPLSSNTIFSQQEWAPVGARWV